MNEENSNTPFQSQSSSKRKTGERIGNWIRDHKILSGFVAIFIAIVVIVAVVLFLLAGMGSMRFSTDTAAPSPGFATDSFSPGLEQAFDMGEGAVQDGDQIPGVEIREGNITAKTEDTVRDESVVRSLTEEYQGYVEESSRRETTTLLRTNLITRVPVEGFDSYFQTLRERLNVETYDIRNFRIEIERQQTQLDIIRDAFDRYSAIKEEIQDMPVGQEKINLIMEVTELELDLKQRERRFQQQITDVTRRGDMATVNVILEEELRADIWPEGLGNQFRDEVRKTIESITNISVALITTSFVVLFGVVQWIIYILIVIIPVWIAYRLLRRLYKNIYKS